MALAPDDRDLLGIYADPMLSQEQKIAALQGYTPSSANDQAIALNDTGQTGAAGVPDVPPPAPGYAQPQQQQSPAGGQGGAGNVPDASASTPSSVQNPTQAPGGTPPTLGDIVADESQSPYDRDQQVERAREAARPTPTEKAAETEGGVKPAEYQLDTPPGMNPQQYRQSLDRGVLMLANSGAKPKPVEQVHVEESIKRGTLTPEDAQKFLAAKEDQDAATVQAAQLTAQQGIALDANQLDAAKRAQADQERVSKLQQVELQRASDARARADKISNEIVNMDPAKAGLWAGKNFGEKLITAIGVALMGGGAGATHTAGDIPGILTAAANREVDAQKQLIATKRAQLGELDSVIGRHMAAYQDLGMAAKQTKADILGAAAVQALQIGQQYGTPLALARSQELAAKLQAERQQLMGEIQKAQGDQIMTNTAVSFVRPHIEADASQARPVPGQPAGAPPRQLTAKEAEDKRTGEELDVLASDKRTELARARGDALPEAPPRSATSSQSKAGAAPSGSNVRANAPKDWQTRVADLHSQGRTDEAIAAMPPAARASLQHLFKMRKADMGAGTTDADALDAAFRDLNLHGPESARLVPQEARTRMVRLADGTELFASSPEDAKDIKGRLRSTDTLLGYMHKISSLASGSGSRVNPSTKSEIESTANLAMAELSLAQGQGTIRDNEAERYRQMVGAALADYFNDPRKSPAAALKATIEGVTAARRRWTQDLSPSYTGEGGYKPFRTVR